MAIEKTIPMLIKCGICRESHEVKLFCFCVGCDAEDLSFDSRATRTSQVKVKGSKVSLVVGLPVTLT